MTAANRRSCAIATQDGLSNGPATTEPAALVRVQIVLSAGADAAFPRIRQCGLAACVDRSAGELRDLHHHRDISGRHAMRPSAGEVLDLPCKPAHGRLSRPVASGFHKLSPTEPVSVPGAAATEVGRSPDPAFVQSLPPSQATAPASAECPAAAALPAVRPPSAAAPDAPIQAQHPSGAPARTTADGHAGAAGSGPARCGPCYRLQ